MKKSKLITTFLVCVAMLLMLTACIGTQDKPDIQSESDPRSESDTQGEQNETEGTEPEVTYTVSTTSSTDDYGLAGSYTMLNAKKYGVGKKVTLSATVNNGYNFEGWYINDICLSTELEYTHVMQNKDITIDAKFSSYTITTRSSSNEASVAGKFTNLYNKKVSVGETVELTATVNEGYNFEGWYIDDICVSKNLNYEYTMEKSDVSICAIYSGYTLTTTGCAVNSYGDEESGFAAGTYTQYAKKHISAGTTVTLAATVNDGYNFVGWYVGDACVSTSLEYSFTMGKADMSVKAKYVYYILDTCAKKYDYAGYLNKPRIHYEFDSSALHVSPIYENKKMSVGTEITVTATDIEGHTFVCWRTYDSILCQDKTYSFEMVASDMYLYAYYEPNN